MMKNVTPYLINTNLLCLSLYLLISFDHVHVVHQALPFPLSALSHRIHSDKCSPLCISLNQRPFS